MTTPAAGNRPGSPPRVVLWAVVGVLALGLVAAWLLLRDDGAAPTSPARGEPTSQPPLDRDAAALALLDVQAAALTRGGQAAYVSTWADDAAVQARGRVVFANLEDVSGGRVDLRYVGGNAGALTAEQLPDPGAVGWSADVEVTWRPVGAGEPVRSTVTYAFVEAAGAAAVVDIEDSDAGRAPIWLLGDLVVRDTPTTVAVATTRATARELAAHLRAAARDIRDVLPGWQGRLVAYLPETTEQLESLTGSAPGGHDGIAAVTTTIDGSSSPEAPAAIMINPTVFERLGRDGRHVVVTHEAVHVATGAVTVSMPLWVAEGFADYVGVGAVDVPLSVAARQAVNEVRESGPPATLPGNPDFAASSDGLGATYELAWLAARLIAEEYGEPALVAFYQAVTAEPSDVEAAFDAELDTTEADFTRLWREYLVGLANAR